MSCAAATLPLRLALSLAIHIHRIGLAAAMLLAGRAPPASAPAATAASATGLLGLVWSFIHVSYLFGLSLMGSSGKISCSDLCSAISQLAFMAIRRGLADVAVLQKQGN
jgi:hypothetical protein